MQFYLVIALLFAISVAMFAVQNSTPVDISFLFYRFQEISLVVVILTSALVGALVIFFLSLVKQISLTRRISGLEKQNQVLEKEMEKLKAEQRTVEKDQPADS